MTFEEFWSLYPRKTNKSQARKVWKKLNPNQFICDQIAFNLSARMAAGEWQEKQFIPHPSTYLNNERWEDEIIGTNSTKHRSLLEDLTDQSWAH